MDMSGMDMGSVGLFKSTNMSIARSFWYLVAAVVALKTCERGYSYLRTKQAKRKSSSRADVPSRPMNIMSRTHETVATICREMTYPQLSPFKGTISRHFSLPPLGNSLILAAYWITVLTMLWSNVITTPSSSMYAYKWEKVGFRAAWVSVTQLPLLYCLSGKFNIVSLLTGVSYERLNWLHRWVARTMFLTVIVHWSFFFTEWSIADFVKFELQIMPMVKYGFGAWAVLGWSVITGFGFVRNMSYELWVLQHVASAGVLLWLLWVHVPAYARYNIWLSIGFIAFDRGMRGLWSVIHNLHLNDLWKRGNSGLGFGFRADAVTLPRGYIHLKIHDINFSWTPGQHVFISMPTCGIFESHPFTIATSTTSNLASPRSIDLYFKCHSGFTKRLLTKAQSKPNSTIRTRTFLSRPFGVSPLSTIERCNSLILVASSTGASFTVPILEHSLQQGPFIQRIRFYWIVRHRSQLHWFDERIAVISQEAERLGVDFAAQFFVTGKAEDPDCLSIGSTSDSASTSSKEIDSSSLSSVERSEHEPQPPSTIENEVLHQLNTTTKAVLDEKRSSFSSRSSPPSLHTPRILTTPHRPPAWDTLIHPTVVEAEGETAIVACGGRGLMAEIRNYVAKLSDERAVHKGTGAQGIYLFTETYGW